MKKRFLFLMLWGGIAGQGWSHEAPIPINHMQWIVDPGVLHLRFHTDAPWWGLNVFGDQAPPPVNWPPAFQKAAKDYFDRHFVLRADGAALNSQLVACRYAQEVWQYTQGSYVELEFSYALPASVHVISGEATFYKEEKEEQLRKPEVLSPKPRFETYLRINGSPTHSMTLTLDHPEFSFAFDEIVRSSGQRWRDAWVEGLGFWKTVPWLVFIFGAFQLQLRTRTGKSAYSLGLLGASLLTAAGLNVQRGVNSGYGVGGFMSLLIIALAIDLTLRGYRRRLQRASEAFADTLFITQVRFVSSLLGGVALLIIGQSFHRPS